MYSHVAVFTLDGDFLGYAVKEVNNRILQSTHLYAEDEGEDLAKRIAELNESQNVLAAWPDARDPDVQALVNDPGFEPVEMVEDDVLDEESSYVVYLKDAEGEETIEIDPNSSVLRYKKQSIPKYPSAFFERTKKACEIVARQRTKLI